jgi:hypothetical protein
MSTSRTPNRQLDVLFIEPDCAGVAVASLRLADEFIATNSRHSQYIYQKTKI